LATVPTLMICCVIGNPFLWSIYQKNRITL